MDAKTGEMSGCPFHGNAGKQNPQCTQSASRLDEGGWCGSKAPVAGSIRQYGSVTSGMKGHSSSTSPCLRAKIGPAALTYNLYYALGVSYDTCSTNS